VHGCQHRRGIHAGQIARELGVRYVLEGSVQRAGNRVRVNSKLIDAERDANLWAERFDRDVGDLFALQDEITSSLAVALNLELINAEAARPTDHPEALDYIFRGRAAAWGKQPSDENWVEAISLFEHALALNPRSVEAQGWLASVLANRSMDFPSAASDGDLKRAEELATKAVAELPRSPLAHNAKGRVLRAQHRYAEAIPEYEAVLALNRNDVGAIFALGWCKFYAGFIGEMIPLLEQTIRLSPRDPYIASWYAWIGRVHLLLSRTDEAIIWLEKARSAVPTRPVTRCTLAAAYALKGETERAAAELAEGQRVSRDGRYSSIARVKAVGIFGVPKIRALFETTYLVGFGRSGTRRQARFRSWASLRHRRLPCP
jgi:adenylate cyclase